MLKKVGAAAGVAASFMMMASPAFAAPQGDSYEFNNGPLLSAVNGNNVNAVVGVCNNNIVGVPIQSPMITENCAAGQIVDGDDVNFHDED